MTTENEGQVEGGEAGEGQVEGGEAGEGQVEGGEAGEGQVDGGEAGEGAGEGEGAGTQEPQHISRAEYEAEREKRIRLEAERDFLQRSQPVHDPRAAEEARIEAERLALMSPEEKATYNMHKEIRGLKQQQDNFMLMQRFQAADNADRQNYVAVATGADARKAELYSKNMGAVEQRLAEYRKNNVYPTREEVLKLVLGEQAMAAVSKGPNKSARQAAKNRVLSTQGKPVGTPNSAASAGKSTGDKSLAELKAKAVSDWKKQRGVN